MRRLSLILLTLFAFACVSLAQKGSTGSTGGTSMSSGGAAATSPTTTGQQTPLAPGTTTTFNPGNPEAPTGGSPMVPGSAVPTPTSNEQFNNFNNGVAGVGTTGGIGAVAPSFHFETQLPPPGATENGTGTAGVTNGGPAGNPSPMASSVAVYDNATRGANPNNGAGGPAIIDVAGDLAGMTFVNGNLPAEQAADNRSLGEIAAQFRRQRNTQAHVYTNDDIARLNARNDVSIMGANQNVALPQGEGAPAQQQPAVKKNQKRTPFTPQAPKQ